MTEKTIAEQLPETGRATLYTTACDLLRPHKNPYIALDSFAEKISRNPAQLRALALHYLIGVAADMNGTGGQKPSEGRQHDASPVPAPVVPAVCDSQGETGDRGNLSPRENEPNGTLKADPGMAPSRAAVSLVLAGVFARKLGGDITVGTATRLDWANFERKGIIAQHVARRMQDEISWPDDETPTHKCASSSKVEEIIQSGYTALDKVGLTNVRA